MPLTEASPAESPVPTTFNSGTEGSATARICIVQDASTEGAATFLQAHAKNLPARVLVVHGVIAPQIGARPVLSQSVAARACRKTARLLLGRSWDWELTWAYLRAFRRFRPHAVLAEFGSSGVRVRDAC